MSAVTEHQETIMLELGNLLDAGEGAMVTLVAGETQLVAHRAVLVAGSPVFEAMFRHETLEASTGQVTIPDVEGPVLRQLLAYLYTRRAPRLPNMLPKLLAAADKYNVSDLKDSCEHQMSEQLTVDNAAAAAVLVVRHSCTTLKEALITLMWAYRFEVMATQGWAEAVLDHPKDVVEFTRQLAEPPAETRSLSVEEKAERLIQAAEEGKEKEVRVLLAVGVDVEARKGDRSELTALHQAASEGHVEVVQCLLRAGAELEARDYYLQTPLHYAAGNGHTAVVQLLLAASADHSITNDDGWTPLHMAAVWGCPEVVGLLLQAGADKEATNKSGKTPLDLAREYEHQQVVQLLE